MDILALEATVLRLVAAVKRLQGNGAEASVLKLHGTAVAQRISGLLADAVGEEINGQEAWTRMGLCLPRWVCSTSIGASSPFTAAATKCNATSLPNWLWVCEEESIVDFDLNEEQYALADSVAKQAPGLFPFQARGRRGSAFDRNKWQELADLGWLGLTLPEAAEGLEQPVKNAAPIFEALGAHLALLPYAETLQAAALLAGEQHLAFASHGRGHKFGRACPA